MVESETLTVVRTIEATRRLVESWRARGLSVGFVPTMGWLHAGHLALVERARAQHDRVLATIFVNPLQFGPTEDFEAYPRDDERDFTMLRGGQCDAVFVPSINEMFPDGRGTLDETATRVSVAPLADVLCGAQRVGHFDGVATIVLKFLMIALPDAAYFGEKDYQQLTLIKRMVRDLSVPVRVIGVPIVREADGLALSSRNVYLSSAQRAVAPHLQRILRRMADGIAAGATIEAEVNAGIAALNAAGFDRVDYLSLAAGDTLEPLDAVRPGARIFGAAVLGRTRLIDNLALFPLGA